MNFIHDIITKDNKRCVYKLSFPDGSFYIGSTEDLKKRMSNYKSAFIRSIGSVNKLIAAKAQEYSIIWFEILEVVPEGKNTREPEHKWIRENIGNPLSLNRSKSAFSNAGMVKVK